MSIRNDILNALKSDLETNLTTASGYVNDVRTVKRGIYFVDDIKRKPGISFWCYRDEIEKHMLDNEKQRGILVQMMLYASTKGVGSVENIHSLVADVESFLYDTTHWTYADQTLLGDLIVYEGGVQDPVSIAVLELRIRYIQE